MFRPTTRLANIMASGMRSAPFSRAVFRAMRKLYAIQITLFQRLNLMSIAGTLRTLLTKAGTILDVGVLLMNNNGHVVDSV
jgi:hypothetical protein